MTYRAPLLDSDGNISDVHWPLISDAQWRRLARWSVDTGKDVLSILRESRFMIEQDRDDSDDCNLLGMLPNCGLYGCLHHTGSTHT